MFNAIRILTSFISLVIVPIRSDPQTTPQVVIKGMTPAESQETAATLSLFDQAGLPLPVLEIRRHHDVRSCSGFQGLHRRFGERSIVDICTDATGADEQRTVLHELSHAWAEHFLSGDRKRAFQELRGWTWWLSYKHAAWEDNGAEQAADIRLL